MAPHNHNIRAPETQIYWNAYEHGIQGLCRRNLYAGQQAVLYDQGYEDGLSVYYETKVERDPTPRIAGQGTITQVLTKRNKIEELEKEIALLKAEIRALEA